MLSKSRPECGRRSRAYVSLAPTTTSVRAHLQPPRVAPSWIRRPRKCPRRRSAGDPRRLTWARTTARRRRRGMRALRPRPPRSRPSKSSTRSRRRRSPCSGSRARKRSCHPRPRTVSVRASSMGTATRRARRSGPSARRTPARPLAGPSGRRTTSSSGVHLCRVRRVDYTHASQPSAPPRAARPSPAARWLSVATQSRPLSMARCRCLYVLAAGEVATS